MFEPKVNRKRDESGRGSADWVEKSIAVARRAVPYLALLAVGIGTVAGVYLAYHRILDSPYFRLETVQVEGAAFADRRELIDGTGLRRGRHSLKLETGRVREEIEAHPWVERARVDVALPDRAVVEVQERRPAAILLDDHWVAIDESGEAIDSLEPGDPVGTLLERPLVTGLDRDDLTTEHGGQLLAAALKLAGLYRKMGLAEAAPIGELHLDPLLGVTLVTRGSATELYLGWPPYRPRLERLDRLRGALEERSIEPRYVLLHSNGPVGRAVVGPSRGQGPAVGSK